MNYFNFYAKYTETKPFMLAETGASWYVDEVIVKQR
jgi:hypothetical protein